jgi:uncharacterized protein YecT (DUF1311 family)
MKMRKLFPSGLALALVVATAAHAGEAIDPEKTYSRTYRTCLATGDAARGVTPAMAGCVNAELQRQDGLLNAAYKKAMAVRSSARKQTLRAAQRDWIKRRDSECQENLTGGTIDMIEVPSCQLDMTAVRTIELQRMVR